MKAELAEVEQSCHHHVVCNKYESVSPTEMGTYAFLAFPQLQ